MECGMKVHNNKKLVVGMSGAIIMPSMMSYYNKPTSIEDLNLHIIGKILDKFDIEVSGFNRWGESSTDKF